MFRRGPRSRRRMPVHPRRRPLMPGGLSRRLSLPPQVRQALSQANQLMAEGQFVEAAVIFERLSGQVERRGMLVRAGDLILQASRAHFRAGDVGTAVEQVGQALRLFVRGGREERVPRVLSRATSVLRNKGYDAQADRLEQEAAAMLEEVGSSLEEAGRRVPQATERRGILPPVCKGCGASLVPDEVEWHDARTAECLYCGMVVKTYHPNE
jgi:hypothetical protein